MVFQTIVRLLIYMGVMIIQLLIKVLSTCRKTSYIKLVSAIKFLQEYNESTSCIKVPRKLDVIKEVST